MGRKAEDLTGQTFGFLKVLERAENKEYARRSYVTWKCECILCGNFKNVSAANLKSGGVKSCGCLAAHNGKLRRNEKICVICGKKFPTRPSSGCVTCSDRCKRMYISVNHKGMKHTAETKRKLSEFNKNSQFMKEVQRKATESAKKSPKSGRFKTNIHAIDWHLISPEGEHFRFHSLDFWLREHCLEFFGCEPDSKGFLNAKSGLGRAKRSVMGKLPKGQNPGYTYKGWQVIPTKDDM